VADVEVGLADREWISGTVASARIIPPLDSKKTVVATFRCSRAF
jgi:hypothetical protein